MSLENKALTHFCPPFQHLLSEILTSLSIMGAPRVPPLNPSETIVLWEHYKPLRDDSALRALSCQSTIERRQSLGQQMLERWAKMGLKKYILYFKSLKIYNFSGVCQICFLGVVGWKYWQLAAWVNGTSCAKNETNSGYGRRWNESGRRSGRRNGWRTASWGDKTDSSRYSTSLSMLVMIISFPLYMFTAMLCRFLTGFCT